MMAGEAWGPSLVRKLLALFYFTSDLCQISFTVLLLLALEVHAAGWEGGMPLNSWE